MSNQNGDFEIQVAPCSASALFELSKLKNDLHVPEIPIAGNLGGVKTWKAANIIIRRSSKGSENEQFTTLLFQKTSHFFTERDRPVFSQVYVAALTRFIESSCIAAIRYLYTLINSCQKL